MTSTDPAQNPRSKSTAADARERGKIVKIRRKARDWSQAELGRRCGMSAWQISRLETGATLLTDIDVLQRLADALEVPLSEFVPDDDGQLVAAGRRIPAGSQRNLPVPAVPRARGTARPVRPPAELPPDVQGFVAREDELRKLDAILASSRKQPTSVVSCVISGMAGVGKTSLAKHWAHRVAGRFPDGQLYVDLRGFDASGPVDPNEALRGFLHRLGVDPRDVPADLSGQVSLYRSLLAGKRVLVVLDNALNSNHVRPLLPGRPGCLVVVTSRNTMTGLITKEGVRSLHLDRLTEAESRALLVRQLGEQRVAEEPEAVHNIIQACSGLPLTLAVVRARADTSPRFPLAAFARELRDSRSQLAVVVEEPDISVRAVFSWSYDKLGPDAQRAFRLLGLHPGPDATALAITSLTGLPAQRNQAAVNELRRAALLDEPTPGRYTFHDLLRAYAQDLCRTFDSEGEQRLAILRMVDYYLGSAYIADRRLRPGRDPIDLIPSQYGVVVEQLTDSTQALEWFVAEHKVLLAVLDLAAAQGFDSHTWQLALSLDTFLERQGHRQDYVASWQTALDATQRLGERRTEARAHKRLAHAYVVMGCFAEAHTHLQHGLRIHGELDDGIGQAHTFGELAGVFARHGQFEEALEYAQYALESFRATKHRPGQARSLNDIGWIHTQLGNFEQALASCDEAISLHQALGTLDDEARTWDSLGYAHHRLGSYQLAIDCYRRGLELFEELGDLHGFADSLSRLAEAWLAAGDPYAAAKSWGQALEILSQLRLPEAEAVRARLAALNRGRPTDADSA